MGEARVGGGGLRRRRRRWRRGSGKVASLCILCVCNGTCVCSRLSERESIAFYPAHWPGLPSIGGILARSACAAGSLEAAPMRIPSASSFFALAPSKSPAATHAIASFINASALPHVATISIQRVSVGAATASPLGVHARNDSSMAGCILRGGRGGGCGKREDVQWMNACAGAKRGIRVLRIPSFSFLFR